MNTNCKIREAWFDAYNESDVLITAFENYRKRTALDPERAFTEQFYRIEKYQLLQKTGINLSDKSLIRLKQSPGIDKKTEYRDNVNHIEVELKFSLAKHKLGIGLIRTKLEETIKSSIMVVVIAMNVDRLTRLHIHGLI